MNGTSNDSTSLALMSDASRMLAEASTIQQAKELKDLALTAADWARRKGMGDEAIQYAKSYALRAERKMGEMLKATELQHGARGVGKSGVTQSNPTPTLSELEITKRDSADAQFLASLEEEEFEKVATGKKTKSAAKKEARKRELKDARDKLAEEGRKAELNDRWNVEVADIREHTADSKFDFIITDPPYKREYIELYEVLAERSLEWLKPSGLLLAMCGQSYLAQIMESMSRHLTYYWTGCYLLPGQPTPLRQRQVNTSWKPILVFGHPGGEYKGKIFGDVWKSDGNDKGSHKWGQSVSGMTSIISQVCLPGQSIFDPFCGAGTTGISALRHGCSFDGIDIEQRNVDISRARLAEVSDDS